MKISHYEGSGCHQNLWQPHCFSEKDEQVKSWTKT